MTIAFGKEEDGLNEVPLSCTSPPLVLLGGEAHCSDADCSLVTQVS